MENEQKIIIILSDNVIKSVFNRENKIDISNDAIFYNYILDILNKKLSNKISDQDIIMSLPMSNVDLKKEYTVYNISDYSDYDISQCDNKKVNIWETENDNDSKYDTIIKITNKEESEVKFDCYVYYNRLDLKEFKLYSLPKYISLHDFDSYYQYIFIYLDGARPYANLFSYFIDKKFIIKSEHKTNNLTNNQDNKNTGICISYKNQDKETIEEPLNLCLVTDSGGIKIFAKDSYVYKNSCHVNFCYDYKFFNNLMRSESTWASCKIPDSIDRIIKLVYPFKNKYRDLIKILDFKNKRDEKKFTIYPIDKTLFYLDKEYKNDDNYNYNEKKNFILNFLNHINPFNVDQNEQHTFELSDFEINDIKRLEHNGEILEIVPDKSIIRTGIRPFDFEKKWNYLDEYLFYPINVNKVNISFNMDKKLKINNEGVKRKSRYILKCTDDFYYGLTHIGEIFYLVSMYKKHEKQLSFENLIDKDNYNKWYMPKGFYFEHISENKYSVNCHFDELREVLKELFNYLGVDLDTVVIVNFEANENAFTIRVANNNLFFYGWLVIFCTSKF